MPLFKVAVNKTNLQFEIDVSWGSEGQNGDDHVVYLFICVA